MAIKSYKGMEENMRCRGFQYKTGETYETDKADVCNSGFHACESPLDVFGYYPPCNSRYFEVEQDGKISRGNVDSKVASTKIKIGAEIGIPGIVRAHVEWAKKNIEKNDVESNTGNRSAATNTGNQSAATNTGNRSAATNTGDWSAATNTGDWSAAEVTGRDSVAIATGYKSKAKGAIGCAIVIVERGEWNGETYPLIAIKAAIVDGENIKSDVWYTLKDGEFVEVEE